MAVSQFQAFLMQQARAADAAVIAEKTSRFARGEGSSEAARSTDSGSNDEYETAVLARHRSMMLVDAVTAFLLLGTAACSSPGAMDPAVVTSVGAFTSHAAACLLLVTAVEHGVIMHRAGLAGSWLSIPRLLQIGALLAHTLLYLRTYMPAVTPSRIPSHAGDVSQHAALTRLMLSMLACVLRVSEVYTTVTRRAGAITSHLEAALVEKASAYQLLRREADMLKLRVTTEEAARGRYHAALAAQQAENDTLREALQMAANEVEMYAQMGLLTGGDDVAAEEEANLLGEGEEYTSAETAIVDEGVYAYPVGDAAPESSASITEADEGVKEEYEDAHSIDDVPPNEANES